MEHANCNRFDNSKGNLLERHRLYQANAKQINKYPVKGKDELPVGVRKRFRKDKLYAYTACITEYTLDGITPTAGRAKIKYFIISEHGEEKARELAIAYRSKHTLQKGMVGLPQDADIPGDIVDDNPDDEMFAGE